MPRLTHLCLGMCALSLLAVGIFTMPLGANAAPALQQNNSPSCGWTHQVAAGENLSTIAAAYHIPVAELAENNGLSDPNLIVVGQTLCLSGGGSSNSSEDWGSYGVPGQSYDPSTMNKGSGGGYSQPGPQQESAASVYYGVPGQAYDPSMVPNQGNGSGPQDYGPQQYGPQQSGPQQYGPQEYGHEEYSEYEQYGAHEEYGPLQYEEPASSYGSPAYGVPGKADVPPAATPQPTRQPQQPPVVVTATTMPTAPPTQPPPTPTPDDGDE